MATEIKNTVITAGFIEKPLRAINREFAGKVGSVIKKTINIESKVESQELNTWLLHFGSFSHQLSEIEIEQLEITYKELFGSYHDKNIVKLLKRDIESNSELHETSGIIDSFLKVYNPIIAENLKVKIQGLQTEVPDIFSQVVKSNTVILWQLNDNYRFTFNNQAPVEFTQTDLLSKEFNILNLIDKAILFNFFSVWSELTIKQIQNINTSLSGLFKLVMNYPKVIIYEKDINERFILYLRIIVAKLSALEESTTVLSRIFSLHSKLKKELLNVADQELLNKTHLKEIFENQNSIAKIALQLLQSIEEKTAFCKEHLRDYAKQAPNSVSIVQFMQQYNDLILFTSTIFLESEKLKLWTDKYQDIPYYTFSSTLFSGLQTDKIITMKPGVIISAIGLFKNYNLGATTVYAIRGLSIDINKGEFLVIFGTSGAGKTTLLNCLAGLDSPDRGVVYFNGKNLHRMKDKEKSKLRLEQMGFIFQNYALLPHYTAKENVALPSDLVGMSTELQQRIQDLLNGVGINLQAKQQPSQLSGGQMQRVGIARALANHPTVIFADEPTGDLDSVTGKQVLDLLKKFHDETSTTIVVITHDKSVANYATRIVTVSDGVIINDSLQK